MIENNNQNSRQAASTAFHNAPKLAKIAQAGIHGGSAGAAAEATVQYRKEVLVVVIAVLLLPVLVLIMLPGAIFGTLTQPSTAINNDLEVAANVIQLRNSISNILQEAYEDTLAEIESERANLTYSDVVDSVGGHVSYNAFQLISMYCAYQGEDDYTKISLTDLSEQVQAHQTEYYAYTTSEEVRTEPVQKEVRGQTITVQEDHTYTVFALSYVGDDYFADTVWQLDDKQKSYADAYTHNLTVYLHEIEEREGISILGQINDALIDDDSPAPSGGFGNPFNDPNWEQHITSFFGKREDVGIPGKDTTNHNLRFISKRYYTYIYNPPAGYAWQVVALVGEEIAGGTEIPDVPSVPEPKYYSAAWTAPAQSASGSFDLTFTVNTDKYQLNTLEKVDGAVITVTPSRTGGSVDGGSWQMTPAGAQTITTSCHTQDDSFHVNGGDGSATWTVHYEVSKTSTSTLSGQEGPFTSQAEADAAAETAKNAAIGQLQNEAQGMVDAAIASARAQLANITFSYDEITIPHGFDSTPGALGSHQTITVPANSSNDYQMKNDEWSVKVSIDKIDSETKQRIKSDTEFKIFEWDAVRQCYIPAGGYNQYKVERQADGTYKVINHSDYAGGSDDLFYTQRNEGKLASKIAIFSVIRRALSFSRPVGQASRNHSFLYRKSRRITSSPVLREVVRRRNFSGSKPGTWFKDATVALVVYSIGS